MSQPGTARKPVEQIIGEGVSKQQQRAWLASASTGELQHVLRSISIHNSIYTYARTELDARLAEAALKPHWTVVPTFWLVLVSVILALAALILAAVALR